MAKLIAMFLLNLMVLGQDGSRDLKDQGSKPPTGGEVRIPYRSTQPLFQGKQGNQKTDIRFGPGPGGYFIPNIRRENFVVYENNVRQQNVGVEIEHPICFVVSADGIWRPLCGF